MRPSVAILSLFAFVATEAYAVVYSECASLGLVGNEMAADVLSLGPSLMTQVNEADCNTACVGNSYAVWGKGVALDLTSVDPLSLIGICWCSNNGLPPHAIAPGSDSAGGCISAVPNLLGVKITYLPSGTLTLNNCLDADLAFTPNLDTLSFPVTRPDLCYSDVACSSKKYIALTVTGVAQDPILGWEVGRSGGTFMCHCSSGTPAGTSINCGAEMSTSILTVKDYSYILLEQVVPTGGFRRRNQPRIYSGSKRYCPGTLTPCNIPGKGPDAFECVDIATDLESCGGCPAGVHDVNIIIAGGVDCTRLPGVSLGGSHCSKGGCQVTHCMPGYRLVGGRCVKL